MAGLRCLRPGQDRAADPARRMDRPRRERRGVVAAPVALPVVVATGAGIGAWIGHLARGMSRKDARELGETLEAGTATLIVVGIDKDQEREGKESPSDEAAASLPRLPAANPPRQPLLVLRCSARAQARHAGTTGIRLGMAAQVRATDEGHRTVRLRQMAHRGQPAHARSRASQSTRRHGPARARALSQVQQREGGEGVSRSA